uniref:Carboxyesterase 2B n=1 Tax=Mus musculus TaxID=10090 RepID=E0CXA5_MOUSE
MPRSQMHNWLDVLLFGLLLLLGHVQGLTRGQPHQKHTYRTGPRQPCPREGH